MENKQKQSPNSILRYSLGLTGQRAEKAKIQGGRISTTTTSPLPFNPPFSFSLSQRLFSLSLFVFLLYNTPVLIFIIFSLLWPSPQARHGHVSGTLNPRAVLIGVGVPQLTTPSLLQRLRDVIDSRIAEEQARQKSSQEALSRSNSARRPPGRNGSPSRRPGRPRRNTATPIRGPDPKEFEADFSIGDEEGSTRSGTPQPESTAASDAGAAEENNNEWTKAPVEEGAAATTGTNQAPSELPPEIRAKIRRLDKMETRYHGRVFVIDSIGQGVNKERGNLLTSCASQNF